LGKLIRILSEIDRLLDEALKIIDEKRVSESERAKLYEDYREDLRNMFSILGSLMWKMHADRTFDPEDERGFYVMYEAKIKEAEK